MPCKHEYTLFPMGHDLSCQSLVPAFTWCFPARGYVVWSSHHPVSFPPNGKVASGACLSHSVSCSILVFHYLSSIRYVIEYGDWSLLFDADSTSPVGSGASYASLGRSSVPPPISRSLLSKECRQGGTSVLFRSFFSERMYATSLANSWSGGRVQGYGQTRLPGSGNGWPPVAVHLRLAHG